MSHKQVIVRVNARCDEGIAPLITTLSGINGLITLDSCESGIFGEGHVFFTWGDDWAQLGRLLDAMYEGLDSIRLADCCSLRLEWNDKSEWPRALLVIPKEHVATVTEGIRGLAHSINLRMSQSDSDSQGRELPHLTECQTHLR